MHFPIGIISGSSSYIGGLRPAPGEASADFDSSRSDGECGCDRVPLAIMSYLHDSLSALGKKTPVGQSSMHRFHSSRAGTTLAVATGLLLLLCLLGLRADGGIRTGLRLTPEPQSSSLDVGSVSGNSYRNESIGLTYEFPKGWSVDDGEMKRVNMPPAAPATGDRKRSVMLLMVSELPEERRTCAGCTSFRVRGPRILLYATAAAGDQTLGEVMDRVTSLMKRTHAGQLIRGPVDCVLGGQTFSRIDTKFVLPNGDDSYTSDALTIRNGYLIQFTVFAGTPRELDALNQGLKSVQFKP